jgi:hypothetical protein
MSIIMIITNIIIIIIIIITAYNKVENIMYLNHDDSIYLSDLGHAKKLIPFKEGINIGSLGMYNRT